MLNPASRFTAPVQSTSVVITNHDDAMQPDESMDHFQEPSYPNYQNAPRPAVRSTAPVQSTSAMVITNEDDSLMPPAASNNYFQDSYLPEYQSPSPKPISISRYTEDRFLPTQAAKEKTMQKAVGLAAALGGALYLNSKWEKAEAEKTKLQMMDKFAVAVDQAAASRKTNTFLAWFMALGTTGLASYVGIESVKIAKL